MIGKIVTDKDGNPVDGNGVKLTESSYHPSKDVMELFQKVQIDYQVAWNLQNRGFKEFDGYSLLQRAKLDQETYGAYVGSEYVPEFKRWRWRGRKNTARNNVIAILAHLLAGMIFPYCYAYNDENEEDKMTAQVMRILIENHLRKADYEIKFMYMVTSALVNPAVLCEIEYVEALQRIKTKMGDGSMKVEEAVDQLLTGVGLNIVPIDQLLLADFYTSDLQRQPYIIRINRISWDEARKRYAGKYFVNGEDQFKYVQAGKTRVVMAGQVNQTLYDITWTEADPNFVQIITAYYRPEDLEVTFVGGVFMGNEQDIYNSNPFSHRRMSLLKNEWKTIPVYPFAKTGFEPLDPAGRFAYYKSACFKQYWDALGQDRMHQLAFDATQLDTFKPTFVSGVVKMDATVMQPGASVGIPAGAQVTPYQMSPNLVAALNMMREEKNDEAMSTADSIQSGQAEPNITATATLKAEQNAKIVMGVFSVMLADLVRQIGELTIDLIIAHETVGELDASIPESLNMKYQTIIARGKDGGKDVTNKIKFSTDIHGISKDQADKLEWKMFEEAGGMDTSQRNYVVNPYKFARTQFGLYIDPDMIVSRSMGTDQMRKERAFQILTDPRVAPYVDQEAVIDKFVLEEYSDGNPDEFKAKSPPQQGGAPVGQFLQNQENTQMLNQLQK